MVVDNVEPVTGEIALYEPPQAEVGWHPVTMLMPEPRLPVAFKPEMVETGKWTEFVWISDVGTVLVSITWITSPVDNLAGTRVWEGVNVWQGANAWRG